MTPDEIEQLFSSKQPPPGSAGEKEEEEASLPGSEKSQRAENLGRVLATARHLWETGSKDLDVVAEKIGNGVRDGEHHYTAKSHPRTSSWLWSILQFWCCIRITTDESTVLFTEELLTSSHPIPRFLENTPGRISITRLLYRDRRDGRVEETTRDPYPPHHWQFMCRHG